MKLIRKVALLSTSLLLSFGALFGVSSPDHIDAKAAAGDSIAKLDFTTMDAKHQSYADSWVYGDWAIYGGANNNGGWKYCKFGKKSMTAPTDATITYLKAVTQPVQSFLVTTNAGNPAKNYTEWKLLVASDSSFSNIVATVIGGAMTEKTSEVISFKLESGTFPANSFYRLVMTINNTTTSNGNAIWLNSCEIIDGSVSDPDAPVLTGISVSGVMTNPSQYEGCDFDYSGLTFTPTYDKEGGDTTPISGDAIVWPVLSAGMTEIVGAYREFEVKVTGLTVLEDVVTTLNLTGDLVKKVYTEVEKEFYNYGLSNKIVYASGKEESISLSKVEIGYALSPTAETFEAVPSDLTIGENQTIYARSTYAGLTSNALAISGISYAKAPLIYFYPDSNIGDVTTLDLNGLLFDLTQTGSGTYRGFDSYETQRGQQFSNGTNDVEVTLTSQNIFVSNGTSLVINASKAKTTDATLAVFVGDTQIGDTVSLTSSPTEYSFDSTSDNNGQIKIVLTHVGGAVYLKYVKGTSSLVQKEATDVECADITTYVGYSNTLEPTLVPTDATNEKVFEYVSNDPTIATVDSEGNVTGVATGSTTVTVTLKGTELSKTVNVSVERLSGSGTADEPFSTDDVRKLYSIGAMPYGEDTYVYGTITTDPTISNNTAEFSIQSVGSTLESILVYRLATINGEAVTSESKLMKGDFVLICGKLSTYMNQPQVASGGDLVMRYSATAFAFVYDWKNYRYPSEGTTDFCADIENNDAELKALVERYYALDADDKAVVDATQETSFGGTQFTIGQSVVYAAEHMGIVPAASNTMTLYKGNNSMMLILVVTSCVALLGVGFFLLRKRNAK